VISLWECCTGIMDNGTVLVDTNSPQILIDLICHTIVCAGRSVRVIENSVMH
jgi:hypothetical protein